jgi:hypothetical protein
VSGLAEIIEAADPALAPYAVPEPGPPRFGAVPGTRGFVLEAVYEGDALYALGLSRLAEAGDLDAVAALSDLISRSARAHAEGRPEEAEALWESSADTLVALSPPDPPR